ncbi:MAG TPA: hypothetical protein VFI91_02345 [Longimicrobiaceae bacterium]|nr:hypothetical protein [Longimicrobiaceae bacterium]
MRVSRLTDESGVTLIELIMAVVISGFIFTAAFSFIQQQEMAFSFGTSRMNVLQNYRFALNEMAQDLRTVGSGVREQQPFLVYAGEDAIAFNANYATNDTIDPFAVYINPTATTEEVGVLTAARKFTLPNSTFIYPEVTYKDGAVNSPAETIIFYFSPDSTSARSDDFVLYRQVNDGRPAVVARHLLRAPKTPFLEYFEVLEPDTAAASVAVVEGTAMPLAHSEPNHLSLADTGSSARIDRVRGVRVSFVSTNGRTGPREQTRAVQRMIRFPNAGLTAAQTCGERPQFLSSVSAAVVSAGTENSVNVTWSPAVDETAGEADVVRYAIFRRLGSSGGWGEPYFSVPAGSSSYLYSDQTVQPDSTYSYAVAAQDCTPSTSDLRMSGSVTLPSPASP